MVRHLSTATDTTVASLGVIPFLAVRRRSEEAHQGALRLGVSLRHCYQHSCLT